MCGAEVDRQQRPGILIVDDDRLILATLGKGLRDAGYAVREASGGEEALRFCDDQAPDLVMLDARMPGMSGLEVAQELKRRNIPFIFLSAYGDNAIVKEAVEHGAYSYLVKPLDVPQIVPVIEAGLVRSAEVRRLKDAEHHLNVALAKGRATSVAIGLIMERHRISAEEAFDALRHYARSQRLKVEEVAEKMVNASDDINIPVRHAGSSESDAPDKDRK